VVPWAAVWLRGCFGVAVIVVTTAVLLGSGGCGGGCVLAVNGQDGLGVVGFYQGRVQVEGSLLALEVWAVPYRGVGPVEDGGYCGMARVVRAESIGGS